LSIVQQKQRLDGLVGKASIHRGRERFIDGRPSSTILVYFSEVLGFSADPSTFERPRNYTSKLSGLVYCAQLCFLKASLPRFAQNSVGWEKRPSRCSSHRASSLRANNHTAKRSSSRRRARHNSCRATNLGRKVVSGLEGRDCHGVVKDRRLLYVHRQTLKSFPTERRDCRQETIRRSL
jgi:hypothetical protein